MNAPIGISDGIDAKQTIFAAFSGQARHPAEQAIAAYAAINHNMRDVNAERSIFPRHALRDHAQARFRGGKMRKSGLALRLAEAPVKIIGSSAPTSDLRELIEKIAEPHKHFTSEGEQRFSIEGPTFRCGERNAVALIFHELATNAAKYGSLKLEEGRVRIVWRRREDSLQFEWRECHGPPIDGAVRSPSFGGELVRRMVDQFQGTVDYDWQRAGLVAKISFPIAAIGI